MKTYTFLAVVAVIVLVLQQGNAQVQCYHAGDCNTHVLISAVPTIGDCCLGLSNGLYYRSSGGICSQCIVYGFNLPGQYLSEVPTLTGMELGEEARYSLPVAMIKGVVASRVDITAQAQPTGTSGVIEGWGADYYFDTKSVQITPHTGRDLRVTFRLDNVPLEPDETFQVTLSSNPPPPAGAFFLNTVDVTIQDPEKLGIKFTQSEYSVREEDGQVLIRVKSEGSRATPVTVKVTPMNYDDFLALNIPVPSDFPTVGPEIPQSPNRAHIGDDFSREEHIVTFEPTTVIQTEVKDVIIALNDDAVNEAPEEVFVVFLELVSSVNDSRVDLSERRVSLCRIGDNDPIEIGFQFQSYTYSEADGFIYDQHPDIPRVVPIYLIKDIESEQTFQVAVIASPANVDNAGNANHETYEGYWDYSIGNSHSQVFELHTDSSSYLVLINIVQDHLPEGMEAARLDSFRAQSSIALFNPGFNASTLVFIEDDRDLVQMTLTPEFVEVPEDMGTVEFSLSVTIPGKLDPLPLEIFLDLLTASGTANESDYIPMTTLNSPLIDPFNENRRVVNFSVTINDDNLFELTELFYVMVSLAEPVPVVITPNVSHITILDNDDVTIGFAETEVTVSEDEGPATLTVTTTTGGIGSSVFLNLITVAYTATANSDYSAVTNHRLELTSDQPTVQVDIDITNDDNLENLMERFQVRLSLDGPVNRQHAITVSPTIANIYIRDDDDIVIGISPMEYTVTEDVGSVLLTVRVLKGSIPLGQTARVQLMTSDDTALVGVDYLGVNRVLQFSHTVSEHTVAVSILDDLVLDGHKLFLAVVTLVSADTSRLTVVTQQATITIIDNETPGIPLNFVIQAEDPRTLKFSWEHPMGTGAITAYQLSCVPQPLEFPKTFEVRDSTGSIVTTETRFHPSTTYNCSVFAFNGAASGPPTTAVATTVDDAALFQLRLSGVSGCQSWAASEVDAKLKAINDNLLDAVNRQCACGFDSQYVISGEFQCFASSDEVTYRARLSGTAMATSAEILDYLVDWIGSGTASVLVQQVRLDIDSSCLPVVINSFADPECTGPETSSSDKVDNSSISAIIGGVVALLLVLAITVFVVVICALLRRRRRTLKSAHTEECTTSFKMTESQAYGMARPQLPPPRATAIPGHVEPQEYEMVAKNNPAYGPATTPKAPGCGSNQDQGPCTRSVETEHVYEVIPGEDN